MLAVVGDVSAADVALLAGAAVLNVATFAPPWMTALPGLGFTRALAMTQAATALSSSVPAGEAVGVGLFARMLRAWGYSRGVVAAVVAVIATFNVLVKVVLPLAAMAALLAAGKTAGPALQVTTAVGVAASVAAIAALAFGLRRESSTRSLGSWLDRVVDRLRVRRAQSIGDALVHFRAEALGLLGRRWASLVVWTVVGHLCVFVVLLASLHAADVGNVAFVDAFAAWALTRLLTAIPITPGGLGVVEIGLTGALVASGGENAPVVAAVLLYRAFTWLPTLAAGAVSALVWRRLGAA